MESFFSTLKTERTTSKVYRTRNEARADVFDYIELFYNPQRRHTACGQPAAAACRDQAGHTLTFRRPRGGKQAALQQCGGLQQQDGNRMLGHGTMTWLQRAQ